MEQLNPQSPEEIRQKRYEERFLRGDDVAPAPQHSIIHEHTGAAANEEMDCRSQRSGRRATRSARVGTRGHAHKVMAVVSSVDGSNLMVKTAGGQDRNGHARTPHDEGDAGQDEIRCGKALKVGDRVVAEGPEEKEMIVATTVQRYAAGDREEITLRKPLSAACTSTRPRAAAALESNCEPLQRSISRTAISRRRRRPLAYGVCHQIVGIGNQ